MSSPADAGKRLDSFLNEHINGWSRSRLQRLIDSEDVLVNDRPAKPSYKMREDDEVEIDLIETPVARFEPEDIPLDIVFDDDYLAVINKPAGLVVHPGAGVYGGTLANAIAFRFGQAMSSSRDITDSSYTQSNRPGIVHRLDKDTSGLIVVAKNEQVQEALSEQFRERTVSKRYVALVHGYVEKESGTINAPIARNKHNRLKMKVASHGRTAVTLWTVRRRFDKFTLLNVDIKTGRTHQIRVHMGYINHPVVGDGIYNEGRDKTVADRRIREAIASLGRFFLHAEKLAFTHPVSGERLEFRQDIPDELQMFLDLMGDRQLS